MIASLRGQVRTVGLDQVVVEVGGVGMLVHTTPETAAQRRVGQPTELATSLVVREDSLTLYGFADDAERDLFELVQTVSGVGPRLALAMLAVHPPLTLRAAISGGDIAALTKVPGIGKKGAERIVLELRDKVGVVAGAAADVLPSSPTHPAHGQVTQALVGLGWSVKQADEAVAGVLAADPESTDIAALLRRALRELGR